MLPAEMGRNEGVMSTRSNSMSVFQFVETYLRTTTTFELINSQQIIVHFTGKYDEKTF